MKAVALRRGTPEDVDAIIELNREASGDAIGAEMRAGFDHGAMAGPDYAVAVADGRVVAVVGLLATTLRVGAVTLPAGQPEYIATDPAFRGHGLARRLLARVEEWSEGRGDLVQIISGVPYFYRQYGYTYGLVRPPQLVVAPEQEIAMPGGWDVRPAEAGDIDRIRSLEAAAQAGADVAMPFADSLWATFLNLPAAPLLVGEAGGRVASVARLRLAPGSPVFVQALAADSVAGAQAVLAGARARHPGATLIVCEREGSPLRAVVGPRPNFVAGRRWVYARVPSVAPALAALAPELDRRLARSAFADESGELDISLYRSSIRLRFERGRMVEVVAGPAIHEPDDVGVPGVPPDLVPKLLFGEGGILALEDHPDVYLAERRALMAALFPPLRVDLLTW